jgi:hypothetical protein
MKPNTKILIREVAAAAAYCLMLFSFCYLIVGGVLTNFDNWRQDKIEAENGAEAGIYFDVTPSGASSSIVLCDDFTGKNIGKCGYVLLDGFDCTETKDNYYNCTILYGAEKNGRRIN